MKKTNKQNSLTLERFTVAKLNNTQKINGGNNNGGLTNTDTEVLKSSLDCLFDHHLV
ncbi:hypothetical protein [Aquimarina sediminis]|uniref:hypothetical protein n=1 Tax=Aquimarina sediminis TaxID=2070536 RepID=UPI0013E8CA5D|nr:hypothetical protein [Aquimarina sediminis]